MMNSMTRREFLVGGAALPFALRSVAETAGGAHRAQWVFLGTDKGVGIYRAPWDATTGTLGKIELAVETDRPDFFAMHPKLPVLYMVNSVGDGKGGVSGYRVDAATGRLTLINRVSSHGDGPCAVSVSLPKAFVANYNAGSFAAFGVGTDGRLIDEMAAFDCQAKAGVCGVPGPVKNRQEAAHLTAQRLLPMGRTSWCAILATMPSTCFGCPWKPCHLLFDMKRAKALGRGMWRSIQMGSGCIAYMSWIARLICMTGVHAVGKEY